MILDRMKFTIRKGLKTWNEFRRDKAGLFGMTVILFFVFLAIFADSIAPYNPHLHSSWLVSTPFSQPAWVRLFDPSIPSNQTFGLLGSDEVGRDIFSEVVYGARASLTVGFVTAIVSLVIGTIIGLVAGYFGGIIESVSMRVVDIFLTLPLLPLIIILAAVLSPSMWNLIIILGILAWPDTARIVRSQVLTLKERTYVEATKALGAGDLYILFRHILPKVIPLLSANATLLVARAILVEAGVSFIGLGDPNYISWGMVLYTARSFNATIRGIWWYFVPPGVCISLTVIAFLLVGQTFDKIFNPALRFKRV